MTEADKVLIFQRKGETDHVKAGKRKNSEEIGF
jgi:hypothetical protein